MEEETRQTLLAALGVEMSSQRSKRLQGYMADLARMEMAAIADHDWFLAHLLKMASVEAGDLLKAASRLTVVPKDSRRDE